jgi:hypothetical protein
MNMSVIGTGRMGRGLAKVLGDVHPGLKWGSRTLSRVQELVRNLNLEGVIPATHEEALEADIIVHALWFRDLLPWAEANRERLAGKILVDIVNPFTEDFRDFTVPWGTSAAEELQKRIPRTRVVGAFKNTFFRVFDAPEQEGLLSDVYVTSDDGEAGQTVLRALEGIPFRVLDGGRLANNRTIERMTLFERELAVRYGTYPYVSFRLFGLS